MIWSNSVDDDQLSESDEDDTDRLFTFEVAKTKEQEESVSVRQGFEVCHLTIFYRVLMDYPTCQCASDEIVVTEFHPECKMDPEVLKPRLLFGETRQGFMTTQYVPVKRSIKILNAFKITTFLLQDALYAFEITALFTFF